MKSPKTAAAQATKIFRGEAKIAEAARRMTNQTQHPAELLWVLWLIVKSNGLVHENERLLLKHVTAFIGDVDAELPALAALESVIELDESMVWSMLESATGDLKAVYEAGVVAAAVDGKINANELKSLKRLAGHCSASYNERDIRDAAKRF